MNPILPFTALFIVFLQSATPGYVYVSLFNKMCEILVLFVKGICTKDKYQPKTQFTRLQVS